MNQKGWALILVLPVVALFFGFLLYVLMQPPLVFDRPKTEELRVQSHTWATNCTSITITVKNTGDWSVSIEKIRARAADSNVTDVAETDVADSNVTYGPDFSGTANTLPVGATGTITITQQFSSGIKYEFHMISARRNWYIYVATASQIHLMPRTSPFLNVKSWDKDSMHTQ